MNPEQQLYFRKKYEGKNITEAQKPEAFFETRPEIPQYVIDLFKTKILQEDLEGVEYLLKETEKEMLLLIDGIVDLPTILKKKRNKLFDQDGKPWKPIKIFVFKHNKETYLAVFREKHRLPTIVDEDKRYMIFKFPYKMPIPSDLRGDKISFARLKSAPSNASDELFQV